MSDATSPQQAPNRSQREMTPDERIDVAMRAIPQVPIRSRETGALIRPIVDLLYSRGLERERIEAVACLVELERRSGPVSIGAAVPMAAPAAAPADEKARREDAEDDLARATNATLRHIAIHAIALDTQRKAVEVLYQRLTQSEQAERDLRATHGAVSDILPVTLLAFGQRIDRLERRAAAPVDTSAIRGSIGGALREELREDLRTGGPHYHGINRDAGAPIAASQRLDDRSQQSIGVRLSVLEARCDAHMHTLAQINAHFAKTNPNAAGGASGNFR